MPRSRKHRPARASAAAPMPNLHFWMLIITAGLVALSLLLHFFAPESKASEYTSTISLLLGFLTGKLSNGFGKPLSPTTPTVEAAPVEQDDDEGEETP